MRITNIYQPELLTCLVPPNNAFFPDGLRYLRPLAIQNDCNSTAPGVGLHGSVHDLTYGFTGTQLDIHKENLWCDGCCPVVNPNVCYVIQSATLNVPVNPWLNIFMFTTINAAINGCKAPTRTIIITGTEDIFDVGDNDPIYNEYFRTTIAADRVNQTGPLIIQGSPGAVICASGHFLDNPLGIQVTLEGLYFRHCAAPAPAPGLSTWYQNASADSQHITWLGNDWDGQGTPLRPIDGLFDSPDYFLQNTLGNYTGLWGAFFTSRRCNGSLVAVNDNLFDGRFGSFPGSALDVVGYASLSVQRNVFDLVGGASASAGWDVRIAPCRFSSGFFQGGTITISDNSLFGNPIPCSPSAFTFGGQGIYQTGYFLDTVPTSTQAVYITGNTADGNPCVAMRLIDDDSLFCTFPDPPKYLRVLWWQDNNKVRGAVYDLRWGYVAPTDVEIDAAPLDITNECYYCNEGCLVTNDNILIFAITVLAVALVGLFCLSWWLCPWLCPCCPRPVRGVTFDMYSGLAVPTNRNALGLDSREEVRPDLGDTLPHYRPAIDDQVVVRRRAMANAAAAGPQT